MKHLYKLLLFVAFLFVAGCSKEYDDSSLSGRVDDLENRVSKLEQLCQQMNSNISSLQTIVAALQNNDYVTGVTPLTENGKIIGYTIKFVKSEPVTIYHGKDGKDGEDGTDGIDGNTPIIGVKQYTDSIYYWTLDGNWLLDDNGNKIKAQGIDDANGSTGASGSAGADGITPQLKIEDGYWHVSYDNGETWNMLGKATGDAGAAGSDGTDGDSFFQSVDVSNTDYVSFTLANGTLIKLPTWSAFEQLRTLCNQMNSNISSLQTIVAALQNNDYVTGVSPLVENGSTIGYTITFVKSSPVTIYHGKDGANGTDGTNGKDGYTPIIGVKQYTDGIYYWTLDGNWLTDEYGNKIKAQGIDGANGSTGATGSDGKDGVTPQLKIEDGYWCISYDKGQTWTQLGKATGEDGKDGADGSDGADGKDGKDGDSFFQGVDVSNADYVSLTLSDGTTIKLPTWSAFEQLRTLCNQMNSNISSLQTIVASLQNNDYVTDVTPLVENGSTIGYTISFVKSAPVTIYHGKDGKDGEDGTDGIDGNTPIIGVKQYTDGVYYWTLNGEWLIDESGNKIKAQGIDGANGSTGASGSAGADGITPQFKIEDGYWCISYDKGQTWTQLGKATGEDGENGDSFFQTVTQDENAVYFTLADGTTLKLPKEAVLNIIFEQTDLLVMHPNSTRELTYTVVSSAENVTVEVLSSADIKAKVVYDDATGKKGRIVINTSATIDEYSKVIVYVSDDKKMIMRAFSFEQSGIIISNSAMHSVGAAGGTVSIEYLANMDCEVVIPSEASSWLSVAQTRAMSEHAATIQVKANQTLQARTATVKIKTTDGKLSADYIINQAIYDDFTATTTQIGGWQADDAIAIFAGNNKNRKFVYSGAAGVANGHFVAATTATGSPVAIAAHYAVYPYNSNVSVTTNGVISTTIAAEQKYVAGGWERKNNIMVAASTGLDDCQLNFQSLGSVVCVKLWGVDQTIKSLSITSNGGESLAGTATIKATPSNISSCTVSGSATIKMNGVNEKTVGASESAATEFCFLVPPVTLSQGYTINVEGFYGGKQLIAVGATTFAPGKTYTTTAELNLANNGMGTGIGGWGDGGDNSGTAD